MRLLVLGGTVFLSRATAEAAVRRGHEVVCAARGVSGTIPEGAEFVHFDRTGPVPDSLRGFDAVVEPGRLPSWVGRAVAALPEAHWVFVSTISVYADESDPTSTELAPAQFEDSDLRQNPSAYGPMKVACEQLVRDGARSAAIVRPGLIVGPGDPTGRFSYWPARVAGADGDRVLAPGTPNDLVQFIDVRDLAEWLVTLAEQRSEGTFDAIRPPLPFGELLDGIASGLGVAPTWVWADRPFLDAHEVAPWSGPRSLPLWVPHPELAGMLSRDAGPALGAGLVVRPVADTARDTFAWLQSTPDAARTGLTLDEEAVLLAELN